MNLNVKIPLTCYRSQSGLRSIYPYDEGCLVALKRAYMAIYRYERLGHSLLIGFEVSVSIEKNIIQVYYILLFLFLLYRVSAY